ncbi:MAG: hypothetical protein ABEK01_04950 [Candidatus Nanohaloarchaea archaeon]
MASETAQSSLDDYRGIPVNGEEDDLEPGLVDIEELQQGIEGGFDLLEDRKQLLDDRLEGLEKKTEELSEKTRRIADQRDAYHGYVGELGELLAETAEDMSEREEENAERVMSVEEDLDEVYDRLDSVSGPVIVLVDSEVSVSNYEDSQVHVHQGEDDSWVYDFPDIPDPRPLKE